MSGEMAEFFIMSENEDRFEESDFPMNPSPCNKENGEDK